MKKSILESIKDAIDKIQWSNQSKKDKALNLCISLYNLYTYSGGDFYQYKTLSSKFINDVVKTKSYVGEIKSLLLSNNIIEINNSYNVAKRISKGYRFSNHIINPLDSYHICSLTSTHTPVECSLTYPVEQLLNRLTINEEVYNWINEFRISSTDIKVDEEITDEYVVVKYETGNFRYKLETALAQAKEIGLSLIQYKTNFYIDEVDEFIIRKENDLRLLFRKNIFDIKHKIFRISRNETNNRLDYNLTNMKSDLLEYLLLDNEELVELDIANAQFAILCSLTTNLDSNFIEHTQSGNLYQYIASELNISVSESKSLMFRVAFDKVKTNQDSIRNIFPITMKFIDNYKNENGYKAFSNLLQKQESLLMIDGVLNYLHSKDVLVFTIHDAVRVKKSEAEVIRNMIQEYFTENNFKCFLRLKNKMDNTLLLCNKTIQPVEDMRVIEYNYKGYRPVKITITQKDKEDFKDAVKRILDRNFEVCYSTLELCGLDKYKMDYLYSKWNKINLEN